MIEPETNVVAFRPRQASALQAQPKSLIERVYSAGSLAIRADDAGTKMAALTLQSLGFLLIEEVLADGSLRPLPRKEAREAMARPWRLVKPAFSGQAGVPDGDAAFRF